MNHRKAFRSVLSVCFTLIIIGIIGFIVVPNALAATGCFPDTNGHWAETFICWLEENGITGGYPDGTYKPERYVTRAEMAVFLQNTYDVTAPVSGEIRINSGHANWALYDTSEDVYFQHYANITHVHRSSINDTYLTLTPDVPSILFGRRLSLKAVVFCYGTYGNVTIDDVWIKRLDGEYNAVNILADNTDRTDDACRTYTLSSPHTMGPNQSISLFVNLDFGAVSASDYLGIGNTTFVFEATDISWTAAAPAAADIYLPGSSTEGSAP